MANFTGWMRLDFDKIAPSQVFDKAGWVRQSPSPYDVPTHGRATFDEDAGLVVIQFKYISDEPVSLIHVSQYLDARIGKKTRRVFEVRFKAREYHRDQGAKSVTLDSEEVVKELSMSSASNGLIASRAVNQNQKALFYVANAQ